MNDDWQAFKPRWAKCCGEFNRTDSLNGLQNLAFHHSKHVVTGNEWGKSFSVREYLDRAVHHLNSLADDVIELTQLENNEVVKFNLATGEVGIARPRDGLIKTFFRPGEVDYVLRKLESGIWVGPQDFSDEAGDMASFDSHPEKAQLYAILRTLVRGLPGLVQLNAQAFEGNKVTAGVELLRILAKLGQGEFASCELQQRVLTEDQKVIVFDFCAELTRVESLLHKFEWRIGSSLVDVVETELRYLLEAQGNFWENADRVISSVEELELALERRGFLGFLMMELGVLKIDGMFDSLNLDFFKLLLLKSDIAFRVAFYRFMCKFRFPQEAKVFPKEFFWRRIFLECFWLRLAAGPELRLWGRSIWIDPFFIVDCQRSIFERHRQVVLVLGCQYVNSIRLILFRMISL